MQLTESTRLRFTRGYRLHHDHVRQQWVIQAPERAYITDPTASAILHLIDGQRIISDIIDELSASFKAPRDLIARDVLKLLSELTEKGVFRS